MTRFGRSMLAHFALDPAITYLNHGTVGAPPRRVLAVQQAIRDEIELQPSRYLLRELSEICVGVPRAEPPRLRTAAAEVAAFFGARGEDLVFVDNATTGANAVLRSAAARARRRDPGDLARLWRRSPTRRATSLAQRGASVREVAIPAATERPEEVVAAIDAALGARTRLVDRRSHRLRQRAPAAGRGGRGALPGARRADPGRRRARAGRDRPRPAVDRRRLVRRQPPQVGLGAAQHGHPLGAPGAPGGAPSAGHLLGARPGLHHRVRPRRDPRSVALARGAGGARAARRIRGRRGPGLQPRPRLRRPASGWRSAGGPSSGRRARWSPRWSRCRCRSAAAARPRRPRELRDRLLFEDRIELHIAAREGRLAARVAIQIYNDLADVDRLGEAIARR